MRHHAFRDVRRDVLALYKVSVQVFDHTRSRSSDRCVLSSFDSVRNGQSFEHMHARTAPHAIPCLHGHPQLHSCVPSLPSAVTIKRNLESILEATTRSRQHSFAPSPTASSRPRLSSRADPRLHVQARRIERHQVRRCVWHVQATSAVQALVFELRRTRAASGARRRCDK